MIKPKNSPQIIITLESSSNQKHVTLTFDSSVKMSGLDFLVALIDYANDLAEQMYKSANERDESKN